LSDFSGTSPADPKATAGFRVMRAVVIGLGVLMVLMFAAVIAGLFVKIKHDTPAVAADAPSVFALPAGARILSLETTSDRLVLRVATPEGEEVDIVDAETGHLVAQIKSAAGGPK
jgi:uncharacterized membrane protein